MNLNPDDRTTSIDTHREAAALLAAASRGNVQDCAVLLANTPEDRLLHLLYALTELACDAYQADPGQPITLWLTDRLDLLRNAEARQ